MNALPRTASRSAHFYARLLALYPSHYLARHRAELMQNFEDLERECGSRSLLWTFIIRDLFSSLGEQYMKYLKNNRWAQVALAAIVILVALGLWQVATLRTAHSSFANYASFRGCSQITSETSTSGTCTLPNGQSITMVQYEGKWYLEGDLPRCVGTFCF
jgi:hypothetical protein